LERECKARGLGRRNKRKKSCGDIEESGARERNERARWNERTERNILCFFVR
jgi:hypothetical protein